MEGLNELLSGMNDVLLKVSKELGMGVDFLKENFIEHLPEIGRYLFVTEFVGDFVPFLLAFSLVALVIAFFIGEDNYGNMDWDKFKSALSKSWKYPLIIAFTVSLLKNIGFLVAPRVWTLHQLFNLIQ